MHAIAWHIRKNKPDIVDSTVAYYTSAIRRLRTVDPELSHKLVSEYLDGIKPTAALPLVSRSLPTRGTGGSLYIPSIEKPPTRCATHRV